MYGLLDIFVGQRQQLKSKLTSKLHSSLGKLCYFASFNTLKETGELSRLLFEFILLLYSFFIFGSKKLHYIQWQILTIDQKFNRSIDKATLVSCYTLIDSTVITSSLL